jgi:gamma-glutamylcyclotransferase (GGCT)/AIG2-like uncharacterized protein YtfP
MIEWKEIPNHENYEASNTGLIRRKFNNRHLKQTPIDNIRGYKIVSLYTLGKRYTKYISRLVWSTFNGCDCEHTVDHIDRDSTNNNIDNLRCITHKENSRNRDTYHNKDLNKYNLDDDKKKNIITKIKSGEWTAWDVMKIYKIPSNYTHMVIKRGTWDKYLDESNNLPEVTENSL